MWSLENQLCPLSYSVRYVSVELFVCLKYDGNKLVLYMHTINPTPQWLINGEFEPKHQISFFTKAFAF